jgi:hypothetical protein
MRNLVGKLDFVTLPFTTKINGELTVPKSSGLNWGQRPGREQNQAYLSVPSYIQRSSFFPDVGVPFLIECDDEESFHCARAQANGKAIHTPQNNSLFGLYFRRRLGVPPGYTVTITHLLNYGRVSADVYKLSNIHYYLDFSFPTPSV